eukprot:SAG11_NODE_1193_length_5551_cov_2.289252_5_plen_82_part_00
MGLGRKEAISSVAQSERVGLCRDARVVAPLRYEGRRHNMRVCVLRKDALPSLPRPLVSGNAGIVDAGRCVPHVEGVGELRA